MKVLCKLGLHKWVHKFMGPSWLNVSFKIVCKRCDKEKKR